MKQKQSIDPNLINEFHPTRNGSLRLEDLSPLSTRRVWWQSHDGRSWLASIRHRVAGVGCPFRAQMAGRR